jgi:four helix bundle protein
MKTFKDIIAWQKGYELSLLLYKCTSKFPSNEEFGLKSELRRASVSYISNIAEGFNKQSLKEALHFYNRSRASLEEIKCQCMLSNDLNYFNQNDFKKISQLSDECGKLLYGWIESQKQLLINSR